MTEDKSAVEALAAGPLLTDADRKALSLCAGILEKVVAQIVRAHVADALAPVHQLLRDHMNPSGWYEAIEWQELADVLNAQEVRQC